MDAEGNTRKVGVKRASKPVKKPQLDALEDLEYALYVLARTQQVLAHEASSPSDREALQKARLLSIENCMPNVLVAFNKLNTLLKTKRPGGAHPNSYRKLGFDIMTDHYINSGEKMKAKDLVRAVIAQLPEEMSISDATGREVFSERIARDVRKTFINAITVSFDDLD